MLPTVKKKKSGYLFIESNQVFVLLIVIFDLKSLIELVYLSILLFDI